MNLTKQLFMKKVIKIFDPSVDITEKKILEKTFDSHYWSSGSGRGNVSIFENKFKKYVGSDECVAVDSGSSALHLALSLIDIKNKEVIVPSLTFVSTVHSILLNGGKPVFVDVDSDNLCLNPELVKKLINKKTKAILPVHFGGMPVDLEEISNSFTNDISIIEDAAHATGSIYHDKKIGSHGIAVCHSFNPTKNLVMPSGGAITLNGKRSKFFKKILNARRWCGISNRNGTNYDVKEIGWNYFMNEFSAAMGIAQIKKQDLLTRKRKKIAKRYFEEIHIETKMQYDENCAYHLYWIKIKNRNKFMKKMLENNIQTGIHYQPVHLMSFYKGRYKLPNTEKAGKEIVSLPMHPNLTDSDVSKVIKFTNKFT
jgi:perosamine synthetase